MLVLVLGKYFEFHAFLFRLCRNRIWLTDLAKRLPSTTHLDGLDISFDAMPPLEWLPPNVTLRNWDIYKEPAEDLHGLYDVINIRNFSFVLKDEDIPEVLARLNRLLSKSYSR